LKTSYEEFEEMLNGIVPIGGFDGTFQKIKDTTPAEPFREAINDTIVGKIMNILFRIPKDQVFHIQYKIPFLSMLMFYRFWSTGKRKFKFNPDVMKLLHITDFGKVLGDSIRLPFPCVSIDLAGMDLLQLYGHRLKHIFVTIFEKDEFNTKFATRHGFEFEADRVLFIMAYAKVGTSMKTGDDDMFYWVVPFCNNENIIDIVKRRLEYGDVAKDHKKNFFHILSFTLNMMLYMTSSKEMIEYIKPQLKHNGTKNPRKLRRRIREESLGGHYIINDKVIITLKDREAIVSSLAREERLSLTGKWIVRGHWREQTYGPGMSLHKTIWIYPYFKGDDISDVLNKEYEVK